MAGGGAGMYRVAGWLGVTGMYAFALHPAGSSLGYIGGTFLMVSLILLLPSQWRDVRRDPVLIALGLLLAYLVLSTVASCLRFGAAYAEPILDGFRGYGEILVVAVAFGWWLARRPGALHTLLAMAVIGLLIRILIHVDWQDPLHFLATVRRPGFGMSVIHFALSAALGVTGLLVFGRRILGAAMPWPLRVVLAAGYIFTFGVVAYALALTGTRMGWLAFAVALPFVLLYMLANRTQPFAAASGRALLAVLLGAVLVAVVWLQWDGIEVRLLREADEFAALLQLDAENVGGEEVSIGVRYRKLVTGLETFRERPVLGWGVGASTPLYEREEGVRMETDDLHNLYMQVLVEMGATGAALMALFLALLGHSIFRAYRERLFPSDVVVWLVLSLVVAAVWAMGNGKLWQAKVRNPFTFLFGVAMAIHFVRMEAGRLRLRRGSAGAGPSHPGPAPGGGP